MSDTLKKNLASRKAHAAVVTEKLNKLNEISQLLADQLTDEHKVQARGLLGSLKERISIFSHLNQEILSETADESIEVEVDKQDEIDTKLKSTIRRIELWLQTNVNQLPQPRASDATPVVSTLSRDDNLQLPRIILPVFSGNYREWKPFLDMFNGSVNNQSIPDVQKMC